MRVLSSCVTALPENDSIRESRFPELAQGGNSFLRTRNSREPIRFTGAGFWRQRTRKDQFRSKCRSTAPNYTCKHAEDSVSCRVQIEDGGQAEGVKSPVVAQHSPEPAITRGRSLDASLALLKTHALFQKVRKQLYVRFTTHCDHLLHLQTTSLQSAWHG
jgi:hypothetical protein